jgi:hypothetical protein
MTDAPEKIWAYKEFFSDDWDAGTFCTVNDGGTAYTRTDVVDAEYERGFGDGCRHIQEDYEAGEQLDLRAAQARIKELERELGHCIYEIDRSDSRKPHRVRRAALSRTVLKGDTR